MKYNNLFLKIKKNKLINIMVNGQVQLVAYGEQDIYLTSKPEITFFHATYQRYSNFSYESIPQFFNLTPNFGNKVSVVLSKNGDMMGKIYLYVELPAIPATFNGVSVLSAWNKKIGFALINYIEFEIGGRVIDRQYGDWMNIWFELTKIRYIEHIIGNRPEMYTLTAGKPSYTLWIPLLFGFCRQTLPLPLISMYHSDVKINVQFNPLNECLIYGPTTSITVSNNVVNYQFGEIIQQTQANTIVYNKYISFNPTTQTLNYIRINNSASFLATSGSNGPIIGVDSNYSTNVTGTEVAFISRSTTLSFLNNLTLTASHLYVDYFFLGDQEKLRFSRASLEILFEYIQYDTERVLYNAANQIKLGFIHPTKELFFRVQPQYLVTGGLRDILNYTDGVLTTSKTLIQQAALLLNGKDRVSMRPTNYFELLEVFRGHTNSPQPGVLVFSFAFAPEDYQPSGACNFSRVDDIVLQLILSKSVSYTNPALVRVYGSSYNVLKIENGRARVVFDN